MPSYELLAAISSHVNQFKPFRKFSKSLKEVFAVNITLVALSIRTGYLVDTVHLPERLSQRWYSTLLQELHELTDQFNDTLHLYEPSMNQSFIVNKALLIRKLKFLLERDTPLSYPTFINLPDRGDPHRVCGIPRFPPPNTVLNLPPKLSEIPSSISEVLQTILEKLTGSCDLPASVELPRSLPSIVCVPLAAVLLEYPVAYVPFSERQTTFLSGVPLLLYRCYIDFPAQPGGILTRRKEHILLQFSCPASLADDPSASIERVDDYLRSTFEPRILNSFPGSVFRVDHERITLDRVAL